MSIDRDYWVVGVTGYRRGGLTREAVADCEDHPEIDEVAP